jgi:hypothetical protein
MPEQQQVSLAEVRARLPEGVRRDMTNHGLGRWRRVTASWARANANIDRESWQRLGRYLPPEEVYRRIIDGNGEARELRALVERP